MKIVADAETKKAASGADDDAGATLTTAADSIPGDKHDNATNKEVHYTVHVLQHSSPTHVQLHCTYIRLLYPQLFANISTTFSIVSQFHDIYI